MHNLLNNFKITPEGTCKVKKGDHLGFLSLALDDETMRIAGEDNPNADCLMLDPSEIDSLNFITNAIVTLSRSNCDPRRTYSLNAIVCLTEGDLDFDLNKFPKRETVQIGE